MANEWTVLYHGGGSFKGRGEFLRLMLEDKGVPYKNSGEGLVGPDGKMCCFRGSAEKIKEIDNTIFPVFFPPAIHHCPEDGGEEVLINQVAACMIYIGETLGYAPSTTAERARADCILMNASDYLSEGRSSFHPVKNTMSYNDQKEEGDKVSKEFTETRMLIWLTYFDKIVAKNETPASPVARGANLTYADFALFHVIDATVFQFDTKFYGNAWTKADVPSLKAYYDWMKRRPNLKAYQESERCPKFAGDSMM